MKPLYKEKRLRVAISISPEGELHLGHLKALAYGKALADKNNLPFHFRYDDIYASTCKSYKNFPSKNDRWSTDNPHVPKPGRAIYEWIRPPHMVNQQKEKDSRILEIIKPDKIYSLSEVKDEIRDYYEKEVPWLADLPIYFTEDLSWKFTYMVRGADWSKTGDHSYWSEMQRCILSYYNINYKEFIFPLLLTEEGEKISKSNPNHSKYFLSNIDNIEEVWEKTLKSAKIDISKENI